MCLNIKIFKCLVSIKQVGAIFTHLNLWIAVAELPYVGTSHLINVELQLLTQIQSKNISNCDKYACPKFNYRII